MNTTVNKPATGKDSFTKQMSSVPAGSGIRTKVELPATPTDTFYTNHPGKSNVIRTSVKE